MTNPEVVNTDFTALVAAETAAFFDAAGRYIKADDLSLLQQALHTATVAHEGQTRKSGEPYITHPIAVATILTAWRMDAQGLAAALMHDTLEDTPLTKSALVESFGKVIAELVDGLSKLERLEFQTKEAVQAENFRKMVLAMARDIRVIVIKLADRLHNMRTLDSMREDKRKRIATETLDIYCPIANRIGLNRVYRELQDLAFKHLHPNRYQVLSKAVRAARGNRRELVTKMQSAIEQRLKQSQIQAQIKGREKNLYSIYKKMQEKSLSFSDVLDIYGFRVIVQDEPSCYLALGALHKLYKPIPGKFKDYLAIPKGNGYQSLHTTLFGPYGTPVEVQIRTNEMNSVAEAGIASHWMYKSGSHNSLDSSQQKTHQWLQNLLDIQAESTDPVEFLEHIKVDLFPDEVYVFTPAGKIIVLPKDSSTIDFAYAVHTDVGHKCIAARVNQTLVPLRTIVHNGDTVEVITSEHAKPNPSWLNFVVSGRARSCIRNYLKSLSRVDSVAIGSRMLQQSMTALGVGAIMKDQNLQKEYLHHFCDKVFIFDDVLQDIGLGRLLPVLVANRLLGLAGEQRGSALEVVPIVIRGAEGGAVQLSSCCHPIPGDEIVGVVNKDQGLFVHRQNCENIGKLDPEKIMSVMWEPQGERLFSGFVRVLGHKERGLLADIALAISSASANVESVETEDDPSNPEYMAIQFRLLVNNVTHLMDVLNKIEAVPAVIKVDRK